MFISRRICDDIGLFLLTIVLWFYGAGGGLMEMKMMKWMMDKHSDHHGSKGGGLSIGFKPVAIPIPIPIISKEKGDSNPEKPWMAESKDMFWKMMMMKMMKGDKGGKGKAAPVMCCPQQMQMQNDWPMMMMMKAKMKSMMMKSMMMKAMKAQPMTCCPQMMQMMTNGGWDNGMNGKGMSGCSMMMNGGWPPPSTDMMCCSPPNGGGGGGGGGGWPDEEEPDYYDEEPMTGWDTKIIPDYVAPDVIGNIKSKPVRRKGDPLGERNSNSEKRTTNFFRKGLRSWNNFENYFY